MQVRMQILCMCSIFLCSVTVGSKILDNLMNKLPLNLGADICP